MPNVRLGTTGRRLHTLGGTLPSSSLLNRATGTSSVACAHWAELHSTEATRSRYRPHRFSIKRNYRLSSAIVLGMKTCGKVLREYLRCELSATIGAVACREKECMLAAEVPVNVCLEHRNKPKISSVSKTYIQPNRSVTENI